jgi:SPP1 gp7 family putative phage head morphogenesis protein
MAPPKVKVIGKRAAWATQFKVETLHGKPLIVAGSIASRYFDRLDPLIMKMRREVEREIMALDDAFAGDGEAWAMDASIASQARILMNAMRDKFTGLFAQLATDAATQMVQRASKDSAQKLGISLKQMSGQMTLKTDIFNGALRDTLKATVAENVSLIKQKLVTSYFDKVEGQVFRSIASGNGLADLQPQLEEYGVKTHNWAKNVALDQSRKAFNNINAQRMQALGVKEFRWIHSGGSNHPREYHRDVLNGKIFSFDDLPHLDGPGKGERGLPGQAPFCRCVLSPVFRFDDEDE